MTVHNSCVRKIVNTRVWLGICLVIYRLNLAEDTNWDYENIGNTLNFMKIKKMNKTSSKTYESNKRH